MRLLILGKNGQVGSALVALAKAQRLSYVAKDRQALDITDKVAVECFFKENHRFDFVINAAAYTAVDQAESDPDNANAVNHLAVGYLAACCKTYHIPLIHISTDYVFDGNKTTAYLEDDNTNPLGQYGLSKLKGEQLLQSIWPCHIILRVSWVFGAYRSNFVNTMLGLAREKKILKVVADQYGAPTSADSIARIILKICQYQKARTADRWGIYHYTDFPVTSWHQLATFCIEAAREKIDGIITKKIIPIATDQFPTIAKRPKNSALDVNKIKTEFSVSQSIWLDEVARVIDQYSKGKLT